MCSIVHLLVNLKSPSSSVIQSWHSWCCWTKGIVLISCDMIMIYTTWMQRDDWGMHTTITSSIPLHYCENRELRHIKGWSWYILKVGSNSPIELIYFQTSATKCDDTLWATFVKQVQALTLLMSNSFISSVFSDVICLQLMQGIGNSRAKERYEMNVPPFYRRPQKESVE